MSASCEIIARMYNLSTYCSNQSLCIPYLTHFIISGNFLSISLYSLTFLQERVVLWFWIFHESLGCPRIGQHKKMLICNISDIDVFDGISEIIFSINSTVLVPSSQTADPICVWSLLMSRQEGLMALSLLGHFCHIPTYLRHNYTAIVKQMLILEQTIVKKYE